jgi:hypothetical protein
LAITVIRIYNTNKKQFILLSGNHIVVIITTTTTTTTSPPPYPFMQGLYNFIPKTNHVYRVYNVAVVLWPQIMVSWLWWWWWLLLLLFLPYYKAKNSSAFHISCIGVG